MFHSSSVAITRKIESRRVEVLNGGDVGRGNKSWVMAAREENELPSIKRDLHNSDFYSWRKK